MRARSRRRVARRTELSEASMKTHPRVSRRKFLTAVAATGAATAAASDAEAVPSTEVAPQAPPRSALRPTAAVAAAEAGAPPELPRVDRPGSDFMVDVIKSLDIGYVASNPASSFRGLHESLLTYGVNKKPEFLTCLHEESSVAIAHGYVNVTGKPLLVLCLVHFGM